MVPRRPVSQQPSRLSGSKRSSVVLPHTFGKRQGAGFDSKRNHSPRLSYTTVTLTLPAFAGEDALDTSGRRELAVNLLNRRANQTDWPI
jgi:hypothetical protein